MIDLNTGEVLGKDISSTDYLTDADILNLVEQANAE